MPSPKKCEIIAHLSNDVCHDNETYSIADPPFCHYFLQWIRTVSKLPHGQIITIDGKKLHRSYHPECGQKALTMVSAWATTNGVVLGQPKVIPELLQLLSKCKLPVIAIISARSF